METCARVSPPEQATAAECTHLQPTMLCLAVYPYVHTDDMSLHGLHYFLALVVAHRHQWPDKRCCKALPAYRPSKLTKMNKDPPMPKDLHRQLFFSPKLQLMHTVRGDHFVIFGLTCHILELKRLKVSSIVPYYRFPSYHGLLLPANSSLSFRHTMRSQHS